MRSWGLACLVLLAVVPIAAGRPLALKAVMVCGAGSTGVIEITPGSTRNCLLGAGRPTGKFIQVESYLIDLVGSDGSRRRVIAKTGPENLLTFKLGFSNADAGKRFTLRARLDGEGQTVGLTRSISVAARGRVVEVFKATAVGVRPTVTADGVIRRPLEAYFSVMTKPSQIISYRVETVCSALGRNARHVNSGRSSSSDDGLFLIQLSYPIKNPDTCSISASASSLGPKSTELTMELLGRSAG